MSLLSLTVCVRHTYTTGSYICRYNKCRSVTVPFKKNYDRPNKYICPTDRPTKQIMRVQKEVTLPITNNTIWIIDLPPLGSLAWIINIIFIEYIVRDQKTNYYSWMIKHSIVIRLFTSIPSPPPVSSASPVALLFIVNLHLALLST